MRRDVGVIAVAALAVTTGCNGSSPSADRVAPPSPIPVTTSPPASPSSTPTPVAPTRTPTPRPTPTTCGLPVGTWSAWQLAGAVLLAPARLDNLAAARPMIAAGIGGVVLFGAPPAGVDIRAQLLALHAAAGEWPLLVASDEEGGGIQRLAALTGALPWPRELGTRDAATIRAMARTMGRALRALSVRIDLAPVADLDAGPGPDALHPDGKRSFSADPTIAATDVLAFARGLLDAGIVPVVKHFPGLGTATANTDAGTATTAPLAALQGRDLVPFEAAVRAGLPAVMTSNAVVPGLSSLPISLSAAATKLLRQTLGFSGAIITDSLSANAISAAGFGAGAAAVQALVAGADGVILGSGDTTAGAVLATSVRHSIVAAVQSGRLSISRLREATRRLARLMGTPTC